MPTSEQTERYRVLRCKGKYGKGHLAQELRGEVMDLVHDKLSPLMRNFLRLDIVPWGYKANHEYFLCTDLDDEHLPWNDDELDW